jgi:hypothetical protein
VAVLASDAACTRRATWARAADQPTLPIAAASAPEPALKARALAAFAAAEHPRSAIADLDGDGQPALLFDQLSNPGDVNATGQAETIDRGVARARNGVYVDVAGLSVPDFVCPC